MWGPGAGCGFHRQLTGVEYESPRSSSTEETVESLFTAILARVLNAANPI